MVLTLSQAQYEQIKERLCLLGNLQQSSNLQALKAIFRDDINSQRMYDRIQSISYLFRILEKRDCIGPHHEDKLTVIIHNIAPVDGVINQILYGQEPPNPPSRQVGVENPVVANRVEERRVIPPVIKNITDRINDLIKREIGHKWKELGRGLGVSEGTLELLENQHRLDLSEGILEVLRYHKEKCENNEERWRVDLQRALDRARRRDLIEDMDEILRFATVRQ